MEPRLFPARVRRPRGRGAGRPQCERQLRSRTAISSVGRWSSPSSSRECSTAGETNDFYITASNNSANKAVLPELWDDIVQIPEYLDAKSLQNGFFWFGPAGTITPFHHDLTNNFMAQVIGRKRILLAPSWDMPLMRNLTHVYCEIDGRADTACSATGLLRAADPRMHPQPG